MLRFSLYLSLIKPSVSTRRLPANTGAFIYRMNSGPFERMNSINFGSLSPPKASRVRCMRLSLVKLFKINLTRSSFSLSPFHFVYYPSASSTNYPYIEFIVKTFFDLIFYFLSFWVSCTALKRWHWVCSSTLPVLLWLLISFTIAFLLFLPSFRF